MIKRLTPRHSQVLKFITDFPNRHKYPAVFSDICMALHLRYDTARYIVNKLAELGYLYVITVDRRTRAILPMWKE